VLFLLAGFAFVVLAVLPVRLLGRRVAGAASVLSLAFVGAVSLTVFGNVSDTSIHASNWEHSPGIRPYYVGIVAVELLAAALFAVAAVRDIPPMRLRPLLLCAAAVDVAAMAFLALALAE
jgi:hypothetical protein